MISEDEGLLEEFRSLRTEQTEVQKARLWGAIPYLVIAGGVATLENRVYQPGLLVFLIFAALPFLWHTANRERSLGRISSYIAAVIEPRIRGTGWEAHIREWRDEESQRSWLQNVIDRWRYIFAIAGIYALIVVFSLIVLVMSGANIWFKLLGFLGAALCVEAYWYLNSIYSKGARNRELFEKVHERLQRRADDT